MSQCPMCTATWTIPASNNSEDATLEQKLDDLIMKAIDMGRCYADAGRAYAGSAFAKEIQWHGDHIDDINDLKDAVHIYINQNYEQDD